MSRLIVVLVIVFGFGWGIADSLAAECSIRDAAMCVANPNCHWDYNARGCEPGPAPEQDACAAHGSQETCDVDTTLGCKWDDGSKACKTSK